MRGIKTAKWLAPPSMRVGIVGCGSIGRTLAKGLAAFKPVTSVALFDLDPAGAGRLTEVKLTTRKPPRGFAGVKYLEARGIDAAQIRKPTVLFRGSARQA